MTPPPFGTFPKKHPFWYFQSSLSIGSLIIMIDISLAESPGPGAWSVLMASWRGFCCYCTEWLILPKYPQMHIQSKYKYNFSEFTNPYSEVNKQNNSAVQLQRTQRADLVDKSPDYEFYLKTFIHTLDSKLRYRITIIIVTENDHINHQACARRTYFRQLASPC